MMRFLSILFLALLLIMSCKENKTTTSPETTKEKSTSNVNIIPISHGTLVLEHKNTVIYVDPVGGATAFEGQKQPNIILVTDIHGDHLNIETLEAISKEHTKIIVPIAVADKLPETLKGNLSVMPNGLSINLTIDNNDIAVEAIPMYNLREEALQFHTRDRGNGYVLTLGGERIYISGDTEDIPEMRALKDIDIAFVCMNLPWTMTVDSAASAVLDFKPKSVYPYHYRGTDGLSDVSKFKTLINAENEAIEVKLLNWYPK